MGIRNHYAVAAWNRCGGQMARSSNEPRGGQTNVQRELMDQYANEALSEADFSGSFIDEVFPVSSSSSSSLR